MRAHSVNRRRSLLAYALLLSTCGACGVCGMSAQTPPGASALPPTTPTSLPAPISATALASPVSRKPQKPAVTYAAGLINVRANDSSLNSILREIARLTGMSVTGGVADQRVFGNYGPAEPSTVIATLLDGTGTNLFIKEAGDNSPAELILTPRGGGPTPPSPNSAQYVDLDEVGPLSPSANPSTNPPGGIHQTFPVDNRPGYSQMAPSATEQMAPQPFSNPNAGGLTGPVPTSQPFNNVLGDPNTVSNSASTLPVANSVPADSLNTPSTATPVSGIVDSPAGPAQGSTTANLGAAAQADATSSSTPSGTAGGASGGAVTPEQIFQKLQQLRRAGTAQGQSGTPTTTPQPTTIPQ